MTDYLHINDNNLVVQTGSSVFSSQGYAWLDDDLVRFDLNDKQSPVNHCRLAPQAINSRYWQQCDQSAISANGAGMRHSADLVWRHLSALKEQHDLQELTLIVPSHYREDNLRLLLGIAKSSGLDINGLANKAVLALRDQLPTHGIYLHIDVQLHQTVISQVLFENGRLSLGEVDVLSEVGIHLIQEALLKTLQQSFIQSDRFDPLHDASTEQQLFDQLVDIAANIERTGKASIGVQHQSRLHNASLDRKEWDACLQPFLQRLLSTSSMKAAQAAFIDLNAAFNDVTPSLLLESELTALTSTSVPAVDLRDISNADGSLTYVTELSAVNGHASVSRESASAKPLPRSVNTVTHLMHAGKAIAIDNVEVVTDGGVLKIKSGVSNIDSLLASGKLFLMNDEERQTLRPNDRLGSHIADGVLTAIEVL